MEQTTMTGITLHLLHTRANCRSAPLTRCDADGTPRIVQHLSYCPSAQTFYVRWFNGDQTMVPACLIASMPSTRALLGHAIATRTSIDTGRLAYAEVWLELAYMRAMETGMHVSQLISWGLVDKKPGED